MKELHGLIQLLREIILSVTQPKIHCDDEAATLNLTTIKDGESIKGITLETLQIREYIREG